MQPTPKWNEELPLTKKLKIPPPRRYEITIDKQPPVSVLLRQVISQPKPLPKKETHLYEIQGTSLRDDELIMAASNETCGALHVDARGNISRLGEQIPQYPSGRVMSKAKLRHMWATGQLRKPPNMVNSFPSARLRHRKRPFGKRLSLQAIALTNPAAYNALAIHPEAHVKGVIVGYDGNVYVESNVGWGMPKVFKKVGRVVKKGAKGTVKVVKKGAKGTARGLKKGVKISKKLSASHKIFKPVLRPVSRFTHKAVKTTAKTFGKGAKVVYRKGVKPVARFAKKHAAAVALTIALGPAGLASYAVWKNRQNLVKLAKAVGKLSAKAALELVRAISSVAATPIRIAFRQFIGLPRAKAIARSQGRSSPSRADKKAAIAWGLDKIRRKWGPLGKITVEILKFTRGVPLAGVPATIGMDAATISAYASAITAALAALKGGLNFFEGLKKGKPGQAATSALDATQNYAAAQASYQAATAPPGQMPGNPGYDAYGTSQDAGNYQAYGSASDYESPPSEEPQPYPGYSAPAPEDPYGVQTPGMLAPDPMSYAPQVEEEYGPSEYYPPAQEPTEFPTEYDTTYDTAMGFHLPPLVSFGR